MPLNYNHLYYFHIAAIEGSVAGAASRLGVTQPTVSEQLRALERSLGNELFERTQAGLRLTESGRTTFEVTSRIFRFGERLVELVGGRANPDAPPLRVGASTGIARTTTPDFLLPLIALDDCIPSMRTGDPSELIRELRGGGLDLVLCETAPPEESRAGLEMTLVAHTQLVAIAPPSVQPASDWSNVQLLQYRASSAFRLEVEAFLEAKGLRPRVVAEADDALVLLEAARAGYVAIVPRAVAADAIASGRLAVVATVESDAAIHALYRDDVASRIARRAVEALIDHAAKR